MHPNNGPRESHRKPKVHKPNQKVPRSFKPESSIDKSIARADRLRGKSHKKARA